MKKQLLGIVLVVLAMIFAGSYTRLPMSSWVVCGLVTFVILSGAVWANAVEDEDADEQTEETPGQVGEA